MKAFPLYSLSLFFFRSLNSNNSYFMLMFWKDQATWDKFNHLCPLIIHSTGGCINLTNLSQDKKRTIWVMSPWISLVFYNQIMSHFYKILWNQMNGVVIDVHSYIYYVWSCQGLKFHMEINGMCFCLYVKKSENDLI